LYQLWREKRSEHLLILVWGIFIIVATWQHIRYEYYIAVPIALLSAFFCGFVVDLGRPQIVALLGREKKTERQAPDEPKEKGKDKGKQKGKKAQKARPAEAKAIDYRILGAVGAIIVLAAIFAFFQASYDLKVASSGTIRMNQDWKEALEWMNTRTPDPGLDYYRIYDKATFSYPPQSYGVMSWWDYGHMITYIAKRIPNANPFQSGVAGENGAATFFLSQSEERTDAIADALGVKYVVTDIEMDTGKFWAMATWYNTTAGAAPYHGTYLVPDQSVSGGYSTVTLYDAPYFQTMISRLHNYDGSMGTPDKAYYIEYTTTGSPYPTVVKAQLLDVAAARADVEAFNRNPNPGYQAAVLTPAILSPLDPVPALRHYRLVHESPSNVFSQSPPDLKYVKVFEHVPGARIAGDGVIELDLVTNAGRNFTYRQASQNGEFVVPYATSGSPNEVRAAGKYRIVGTGREIDVPEEAVQQGLQVR
jgi:dolichyl-diphosphooligosaccharide--protein glycosyltransferase